MKTSTLFLEILVDFYLGRRLTLQLTSFSSLSFEDNTTQVPWEETHSLDPGNHMVGISGLGPCVVGDLRTRKTVNHKLSWTTID